MKTIDLKEAFLLLVNCSAVVWNDSYLSYPSLGGDDDDEFLRLEADDEVAIFLSNQNETVKVSGSSMFLIDSNGEEIQLTLLCPQNLE